MRGKAQPDGRPAVELIETPVVDQSTSATQYDSQGDALWNRKNLLWKCKIKCNKNASYKWIKAQLKL